MKTKQMIFQAMAAMLFVFPLHAKSQIIYPRDSSYTLSPDTVNPGAPFVLHAYNKSFTCNTRFFNQNIQVNGDSVFLSFMDTTALTGIACINASFGPSFNMPSLKQGRYPVFISDLYYCPPGKICPLIPIRMPSFIGTLIVGQPAALQSVFAPRSLAAVFAGTRLNLSLRQVPTTA